MRNPREDIKWIGDWQHTEGETNPGSELEQWSARSNRTDEAWRINESQPKEEKSKEFQSNVKNRAWENTAYLRIWEKFSTKWLKFETLIGAEGI